MVASWTKPRPSCTTLDDSALSSRDFAVVARLAYEHSGITLPENKRILVASRLAKLVRERGATLSAFISEAAQNADTRQALIQALTTNHTRFFREPHHFAHFVEHVRPQILAAVDQKRPARMWSAGSSSGEEVYSLVMSLLGNNRVEAKRISKANIAILATDINHDVLTIGRAGRYDADARNEIPADLVALWLTGDHHHVQMTHIVRKLVRFRHLNLIGDWPIRASFDVIFCGNTMIYFDAPTTEKLQCRLIQQLRPGGHLYIGHSERLIGRAATLVENVGQTIFRKAVS